MFNGIVYQIDSTQSQSVCEATMKLVPSDPSLTCPPPDQALAFWDYAAGLPHVAVDMNPAGAHVASRLVAKDAVFLSPHKLPGGPGSPGILVVKKNLLTNATPSCSSLRAWVCVCVCVCVRACVCVRGCVCVRACVRGCVCLGGLQQVCVRRRSSVLSHFSFALSFPASHARALRAGRSRRRHCLLRNERLTPIHGERRRAGGGRHAKHPGCHPRGVGDPVAGMNTQNWRVEAWVHRERGRIGSREWTLGERMCEASRSIHRFKTGAQKDGLRT